jgi:hypothetical protein
VTQATLSAIQEADLDSIGRFLNANLNPRISPAAWISALRHPWCAARPNFGAQLRDGPRLVGVLCAIYSDQIIDGRLEKFCNPHSWCVLSAYRNQGIALVLSLIKQTGYHFTMLTPNPRVAEIFRHLKFKDLDDRVAVFPNLPSLSAAYPGAVTVCDTRGMAGHLAGPARRDLELHQDIPWIRFVTVGRGADTCLVAYKTARWKRLPCARLIYVSDAAAFDRHRGLLQHHLLTRQGLLISRVESRYLLREPRLAHRSRRTQAKLHLSRGLTDPQIRDLYSELVALDV